MAILGISSGNDNEMNGAEAVVTEFNEVLNQPEETHSTVGILVEVDRITTPGQFHEYSEAHLIFDLGEFGEYPVDLDLPRYPGDEESELEEFLGRLGYTVQELPELEGSLQVPFSRREGEWGVDWHSIKTDEIEEEIVEE